MTIKSGLAPVHPGEILREELHEIGVTATALAKAIAVPANRVTAILNGDLGITADTGLRLSRYFDTTAQFWLNLQQEFEIRTAEMSPLADTLERIVPWRAEALRAAARMARTAMTVSNETIAAIRSVEHNLDLCSHLQAVEQSFSILDTNRHILHALEGTLAELHSAGVFDTALRDSLPNTSHWLDKYESSFSVPQSSELSRLVSDLGAISDLNHTADSFQRSIATIQSPWLDINDKLGSVQRLAKLHFIGELVSNTPSFGRAVGKDLRASLGDWRDTITWPVSSWSDLETRMESYADLGFDSNLTDLPVSAFREVSAVSGIRSRPPCLVKTYGQPVLPESESDVEQALNRTSDAHEWLQRLESNIRCFIDRKMTEEFGSNWSRSQLPDHKYDEWTEKARVADGDGALACHPITYADFTDYVPIIAKRDNWCLVFSQFFKHREIVRESFQRLYPIHLDTMHARPITKDDELLLYVETKRLMNQIDTQRS